MSGFRHLRRDAASFVACCVSLSFLATAAGAQAADSAIVRLDLPTGRSYPISTAVPITRVSVANPDVADVVVMGERDVVINGRAAGETDVIVWEGAAARQHYRVLVHSPADRQQVVLSVKFAEVRRDALRTLDISGLYRDKGGKVRAGTNLFRSDQPFDPATGNVTIAPTTGFGSVLTNFGTSQFLAFLNAEEQRGDARILAEPQVMAANKEDASFLAGGELPIPVSQSTQTGVPTVTIQYREFGIRLNFNGEIISDSLIKLKIRPEVSSLDYGNAITISGFRIPALRTRRMESTIDVRRDQSLVISGMFDDERQRVRTGVPLLMNLPILGSLFSSTQWQRNESELVVVVTPVVIDPLHPRAQDALHFAPDTALPARGALEKRFPAPPQKSASPPPR